MSLERNKRKKTNEMKEVQEKKPQNCVLRSPMH